VKGYDIIGDVHGCATALEDLLIDLGYRPNDWTGAYWHPDRRAVFVGDLVDRGPDQLRVLKLVKLMVDGGSAHIVMGNHEFKRNRLRHGRSALRGHLPAKTQREEHRAASGVPGSARRRRAGLLHRVVQDAAAVAGPRRLARRARVLASAVDGSR
jgi:hypothetical protein